VEDVDDGEGSSDEENIDDHYNDHQEAAPSYKKFYFYPKLLSGKYGNYSITGGTVLQRKIEDELAEEVKDAVKIEHQQGYCLISRLTRKRDNTEPFYNHSFSKIGRDPTNLNGSTSYARKLVEEVINERDIKSVRNALSSAKDRGVGFRIESIVNVDLRNFETMNLNSAYMVREVFQPILRVLNREIRNENFMGEEINQCISAIPSEKFCYFAYSMICSIYDVVVGLSQKVLDKKASIGEVMMIELFECILLYCMNGYGPKLPHQFMFANGIKIREGYIYIPKSIFDIENLNVGIENMVCDAESGRIVPPKQRFVDKHPFPDFLRELEAISLCHVAGDKPKMVDCLI
jgi:hypothetical protein